MSEIEQEKKNKRVAFFTTVGVNVVVLLILLLVVAWRAPNPPLPEFGIELNFGLDTQGSGEVQPQEPVGTPRETQQEQQESKPEESKSEPTEEQQIEESKPEETKPVEQQVTSKVESPVAVKEEKKEESKPVEKKPEPKVEEKPKVDPKSTYNPDKSKSTEPTGTKAGQPGSQGDDQNKTGDKGSPEGKLDAKALYGKAGGGGGGPSLDLAGWQWDERPAPRVPDNELGGIVKFEIKVDDSGDIVSIRTLERSVSPETEQVCKQAIQKLTFTKTGENVPDISTGTITFVVRSK